ncbi:uncharacterized protein LOC121993951 [Zingiber officinale]|uniref:uncharacterized protein LOC121993951 n=1 Tax=Zingiber officinale TaxID=94328 RepID=UPI001C4C5DC1|nr:uncharacterized protein LOC121993951 [Zingiber officinale]
MSDVEQHGGSPRPASATPRRPRPPSNFYSELHNFTTQLGIPRSGRDKAPPKQTREQQPHLMEELEEEEEEEVVKGKQSLGFSIALSHDEIMQDFMAFTGALPPRKPRKKAQKLVDPLFPGLALSKIAVSKYIQGRSSIE